MYIKNKEGMTMDKVDKTKEIVEEKAAGFLSGKPLWAWWISYTVVVGLLFGLFYLALTLLTEKWWVMAILIPFIGIVWSTISYRNQKPREVTHDTEE
jgi:hypothetical protein